LKKDFPLLRKNIVNFIDELVVELDLDCVGSANALKSIPLTRWLFDFFA